MEPRRYYPGAPGLRRPRCTTTCVRVSPAEVYTPAAHPATPLPASYASPATHRTPPQPCSLGVRPVLEPVPRAAVVPRPAEQHVLPAPSSATSTGRHFTDNLGYGPRGMVWSLPVTDDVPRPAVKPRTAASATVSRSKARPDGAEGEGFAAAAATRAAPVRLPPRGGGGRADDVDVWGVPAAATPAAAAAPPTPAATPYAETPLPQPAYPQPGVQPAQLPPPGAVHRHHHPIPLEVRPSRRSPPPHRDDIVYAADQQAAAGPLFTPPALAPLPSATSSVRLVSTAVQTLVPPAPPTPPPPPPLPLRATPPTISLAPPTAPVTPPSVRLERPVSSTRVEFEVVETVAAAPPQPLPQPQPQVTTTRTATTHSYSSAPPASQPPVASADRRHSVDTRSVASEQPRVAAELAPSPPPVAQSAPTGRSEASPPPRSQTPPSVAASAGRPALLPPIVAAETTTTVVTTDVFGESAANDRPVQQDAPDEAKAADDKQASSATTTATQPSARVQKYINDLQAASAATGSPSRTLFTEDGFDAASPLRSVRSQSSSVRKTAPMHETDSSSHFRPIVTASPVSAAASGYDSPTISEPPRATPS